MEKGFCIDVLRFGVIKRAIISLMLFGIAVPSFSQDDGVISGQWIETKQQTPSLVFRKTFSARKGVRKAIVRISALGLYELHINGKKADDRLFTPGWTSYNNRIQYQDYDVTRMLTRGKNTIDIIVGNGWYHSRMSRMKGKLVYGNNLKTIMSLHVDYANGKSEDISTDSTWLTSPWKITATDIYDGERFDARKELTFTPCHLAKTPSGKLVPTMAEPVRVVKRLKPVRQTTTPNGEYVLDFGQNITGWVKFNLKGNTGDSITLRYAETLDKDGNFFTANLRTAKATYRYVFSGGESSSSTMEERGGTFTFFGFRYVKVSDYNHTLNPDDFTAEVISSDLRQTGTFECSDTLINKLVSNTRWSMVDNFLDIPTDCPQRDERLGWTADAQVFTPAACYLADVKAFFIKWLTDMAVEQASDGGEPCVVPDLRHSYGSSGWDDAICVIPSVLYKVYGDKSILEQFYPNMKKWVGYLQKHSGDSLIYSGGRFGDWFDFATAEPSYKGPRTTKDFVGTAYFAYSTKLTADVARVLGKTDEAEHYDTLFSVVKNAFIQKYIKQHSQTCYTLALAFDLVPDSLREALAQRLADDVRATGHITTGFLGTPLICNVLTQYGYEAEAWQLLSNKDYPSWLYPITKGATTMWERWDAILHDGTVGKYSLNHYAYGAVLEWLFRDVAGISQASESVGFNDIVIRPHLTHSLHWVRASYDSPAGMIKSSWKRDAEGFHLSVDVPRSATIILPEPDRQGRSIIKVQAGHHEFSS